VLEYVDDLVVDDRCRAVVVAVVDLRVDRVLYFGLLCLCDGSNRCRLPHLVSRDIASLIRGLGLSVAGVQPGSYGGT
jgi:hypothetical protein